MAGRTFFEQRLELRVLRVRNQSLVDRIEHGLVVADFIVDVRLVESRTAQRSEARPLSSSLQPRFALRRILRALIIFIK